MVESLPSTSGLPVVGSLPGFGALPGAGRDLTGLLSSITQNLPIPSAIGSVISSITSILSGVVPSFLFQLPVVQDAGPMLAVLELLPSLNPSKFGSIAILGSISALQSAASGVSPSDVSLIKTLPTSPDLPNLVTTVLTMVENLLTLSDAAPNLKASAAAMVLNVGHGGSFTYG